VLGRLYKYLINPAIGYVVLRYVTYAISFLNALLLAKYLGGYNYGIYSFILMLIAYMSYSNFGINESLNTEYALNKNALQKTKEIWNTAWSLNIIITVFVAVLCFGGLILWPTIFHEYEFESYGLKLLLICSILNLGRIYITFYKLHGLLWKLNFQQLLPNIILLISALVLKYDISISVVLYILIITNGVTLFVFRWNLPEVPVFRISKFWSKILLRKGITLLMYNLSFYLLTLIASAMISYYFDILQFSCFSFSNSLVNGVIMAGGAFLFIFYPKMLYKMQGDKAQIKYNLLKIKQIYVSMMDTICLVSLFGIIIISYWYPQYHPEMITIYSSLILGKCINNATTGFSAYIISRGKEIYLTIFGFIGVGIVALGIYLLHLFGASLVYITLAVSAGSLIYTLLVLCYGGWLLEEHYSFRGVFVHLLGNGAWYTYIVILSFTIWFPYFWFIGLCFGLYLIFNFNRMLKTVRQGIKFVTNRESLTF